MGYRQFLPDTALLPYIDAYWQVTGDTAASSTERIMPDGCVDIIVNLGADFSTDSGDFTMEHEKAYLVGTMTKYKDTVRQADTHLIGIRFKPAAFTHFYRYASLHEVTDTTIEFEKKLTPEINLSTKDISRCLNHFFLSRISTPRHSLLPVIDAVYKSNGQVSVTDLAKSQYINVRQLERVFKQYMGISPKEFINFARYQSALHKIQNNHSGRSLLNIAFDCGYYDHAHLANEIKKYTGLTPSEL